MQGIKTDLKLKNLINAISGGGGSALTIQEEGGVVDASTTTINFVGASVTASQTAPGVVQIDATDLNSNVANANLVMDGDHTVQFHPGEEEQWNLKFFGAVEDAANICRFQGYDPMFFLGQTPATEYAMPIARATADGQMIVGNGTDYTTWRFPWNVYDRPNADNITLGTGALGSIDDPSVTTGFSNIAIGKDTGVDITDGLENIMIGEGAGGVTTIGQQNIIIGGDSRCGGNSDSRSIMIGMGDIGTGGNQLRFGSSLNTIGPVAVDAVAGTFGEGQTHTIEVWFNGVCYYLSLLEKTP